MLRNIAVLPSLPALLVPTERTKNAPSWVNDIKKKAEEFAAELRAVPEDEGEFLIFERGRDGVLVAVFEARMADNPTSDMKLSEEVTESSELIRCKFFDGASGLTLTYELKLVGKDSLEGFSVLTLFGDSEKEPIKLERVR